MFMDFLRLQSHYERIAWNLKPVMWAHEVLVRAARSVMEEDEDNEAQRIIDVLIDNKASNWSTVIEVNAKDRPGLLYDLTRTLTESNVSINSAVIATYGEQVVDTFYVKDMFGLKFYAKSKQRTLEQKLRNAIEAGAERAREE